MGSVYPQGARRARGGRAGSCLNNGALYRAYMDRLRPVMAQAAGLGWPGISGRPQGTRRDHGLQGRIPRRRRTGQGRGPLPGVRRPEAPPRRLSAGDLDEPSGRARGRRLVLQRLSWPGAEPRGAAGHARGHRSGRLRLGGHPQHLRHHPSPRSAGSGTGGSARQGRGPCCSPPATSPTRPPWRPWRGCCRG